MQFLREYKWLMFGAIALCLFVAVSEIQHVRASAPSHLESVRRPAPSGNSDNIPWAAVAAAKHAPIANSLSIAGEFLPYQDVEIHAKVAGYVRKINVDIGDRVKQGQVLAVLEVPELVAQLQGAGAGVRHSQQEVQREQNEVTRAEADHAALRANALRLRQASDARPGLIAQQELDDAESKDRASAAQVEAARSALAGARQQLEMSEANNSQVSALSDYTRIVAPFDGVVTWRYADTGALVQAGTSTSNSAPVVRLAEVDVLRLRIPVPESIAAKIRLGDPADVRVQATGEHFTGKVARFTDALDTSTRTMQVEIDVPNRNYHLQPGMYADVVLAAGQQANVLAVPINAIRRGRDATTVLVVDGQHRIQKREVRTGIENADNVEILAGLSEGEQVVIGNLAGYREGQLVRPKESTPMTAGAETE